MSALLLPSSRTYWILIPAFILLFSGCKLIGRKMGEGAVIGMKKEQMDDYLEKMVDRMVENSKDELLSAETRQNIDSMLLVVTTRLKEDVNTMTVQTRDSLLSDYTHLRIQKLIIEAGSNANSSVDKILNGTVFPGTKKLVADIKADLLGDSTLLAVAAIRDELLGEKTEALVDSLLKSSIQTLSKEFETSLKPQVEDLLQNTNRQIESTINYAAWALGILAVVLAAIAAFLFRKFSLRNRVAKILTEEVNRIPDQKVYDHVVQNVRSRTKKENVENELITLLKKQNLYQQPEWVDKDQQLLKIVTQHLEEQDDLHSELEKKGLKEHFESVKRRHQS